MNLSKLRKVAVAHELLDRKENIGKIGKMLKLSPSTVIEYLTEKYDPSACVKLPISGMEVSNREQAIFDIISLLEDNGEYVKL